MARHKIRRLPITWDRNVDWDFWGIVFIVEKEIKAIRLKQDLRDPDDHRIRLLGLLLGEVIYINPDKKNPLVKTLIHEALHRLMPLVPEKKIYTKEETLWRRFSDEQRKFLRAYIPKHKVTGEPTSE